MNDLTQISLNNLRAVESVARLGTLAKASLELHVTPGAVSHQIIKAERQLGRVIFERRPKGLELAPFGKQIMPHLATAFRELSYAVALTKEPKQNLLTISVAPVLASKWLVPRLHRFQEHNPTIRVRIDASVELVDLDHSDIDIAIRVGSGDWPQFKCERLIEQNIFPVCHPNFLPMLTTPLGLANVPIVRDQNSILRWDTWLAPHGLNESILKEGPTFSDASLCLDAVIAGQGVMLAWTILATDALKNGRLIRPFKGEAITGNSYWLVTSSNRGTDQKMLAFKSWLQNEIRELN